MEGYIKGTYKRSIFESDKGYTIGLFKVTETDIEEMQEHVNKIITFTGYFFDLNTEDTYIFHGDTVNHPRYGFQFNVTSYEKVKPTDKEGVVIFLSSSLFPGIGEKLAKSIVDVLGENALDEILKDKACLNLVPKLTEKKANTIYNTLLKYNGSHEIMVKLTDIGFTMKDAINIYNEYKMNTFDVLENNIYSFASINEISFPKIDLIAQNLEYDKADIRRLKPAVLYVMNELTYKNGDVYLSRENIVRFTNRFLSLDLTEEYDNVFFELENDEEIVIDNDRYYLKDLYDAEENITSTLYNLASKDVKFDNKVNDLIDYLEKENNIIYNDNQKEAIRKAINSNILIITGGPGTGKTTIIKAICRIYQIMGDYKNDEFIERLALLAPTGRASKRMSESTSLPASTIHRFLKWNKEANEFLVNEYNKDYSKLIIVDEASMIDISLFNSLLKGLTDNIKLILVGDYNQLPSVGPGQLLKDLIESEMIDTVYLNHLYRQDENSYINTLALEIRDGAISENFKETKSDYTFLECIPASLKENLKHLCKQIISKGYDYKRVQLLAPMYKGENGIDALNEVLQEIFNPKDETKREIKVGDVIYRENDKVLQLVNMPEENIYNGDIGIIKYIKYAGTSKSGKNEVYIDFDGNVVKYTPKDLVKIKHGFIISIHKSQGSEFELVVIPIVNAYKRMLYRKLIYTAVTRAKRKLILIGEPQAFVSAVLNNNEYQRNSSLLEKIKYKMLNNG